MAKAATSSTKSWPRAKRLDIFARIATAWRSSLRFRTLLLTLTLSALAIIVACVFMALAIQNDLYQSRLQQVLTDAHRANQSAQNVLDSAQIGPEGVQLANVMTTVRSGLLQHTTSDGIAVFRVSSGFVPDAPEDFTAGVFQEISDGTPAAEVLITTALRESVRSADTQWWQAVSLPNSGSPMPGIVVGQQIFVPGIGPYELYLAYDLADAAQTLGFIYGTLWVFSIALITLVGLILWFVLRSVVKPIVRAATASARLSDGDLDTRLQVQGEDELATLSRSFNVMADSIRSQIFELGELSLIQQRFVSDVSHELRTPLTTIHLASEVIYANRESLDPATKRSAELLRTQVDRFQELLSDLLAISRYDAGSEVLELDAVSLTTIAEELVEQMSPLAIEHQTELRLELPGGHTPVDLDGRRVRRIVRNLIGNAIEHANGKPITITVDSNPNAVAISVRDLGVGIAPENHERIFGRFWRADPSRTRTIGGTGLGLSIAMGDTKLHGGQLQVWSEPGGGSNFVLTLPRSDEPLKEPFPIPADPGIEPAGTQLMLAQTLPLALPILHESEHPDAASQAESMLEGDDD